MKNAYELAETILKSRPDKNGELKSSDSFTSIELYGISVCKKVQDMKRRIEIIEKTDPVLTVSIHQNSYPEEYVHGAQVFYYTGSMGSETLASGIQDQLVRGLDPENHRKVKANDSYYLLKKTKGTIVIVECGFLSNQAEAEKLCDEEYQDRIAWLIHKGILRYLKQYLSILSYL